MAKINIFLREKILNEAAQQKLKIVIFYTEMMRKVVLWCFFMSETSKKTIGPVTCLTMKLFPCFDISIMLLHIIN